MESFEKCSVQQRRPNHAKVQKKTIHQFPGYIIKKKNTTIKKVIRLHFHISWVVKVHQAAQIFITYRDIWEDYILQYRAITTAQIITSQCWDLDYDPCHWKQICVLKVDQFQITIKKG